MDSIAHRLPASLTTTRLVLTTPTLAHVPPMAQLANNKRIYDVLARLPHPYSHSDGVFFVEHIARGDEEFAWAILHDGQFIGVIGLHFEPGKLPELGYWLGEPHWGFGFGTEAATAVVAAARAAGAAGLRARALASNNGSRNVLRKAGLVEIETGPDVTGTCVGKPAVFFRLDFDR